jgi:hypothetical protein
MAKKHPENQPSHRRSAQPLQAKSSRTAPSTLKAPRISKAAYTTQVRQDSIQKQKELFEQHTSRGSWERNHTPLSEIQEISIQHRRLVTSAARELIKRVYNEADSRAYKIAQELFCDADDVVVPGDHRTIARREDPHVASKTDEPGAYSQLGLLYTRVPTAFAENTGLIPAARRSSREVIATGADIAVVTQTKRLMETIKPLGDRGPSRPNAVVLYFSRPSATINDRYAPIFTELGISPSSEAVGSVLYTRQAIPRAKEQKTPFPVGRTAQVFQTIDEALRKTYHEHHQYTVESEAITNLMTDWHDFAQRILPAWVSKRELARRQEHSVNDDDRRHIEEEANRTNEEIIERYKHLLSYSSELLKKAVHQEKSVISDRLDTMRDTLSRSRTQRINPSPVLLQIGANYELLHIRLKDIRQKNSFNLSDRELIREVIATDSANLAAIHSSLATHIERFTGKERIFRERFAALPAYEREKNQFFWKLQIPRESDKRLSGIRVRPFTTFRDKIQECSRQIEKHLSPNGVREVRKALSSMFLLTRAFKAQRIVEELKVALIHPERREAEALNTARRDLLDLQSRTALFAKDVGDQAGQPAARLNGLTSELLSSVTTLQKKLLLILQKEHKSNKGVPLSAERKSLHEEALEALTRFNFEAFARDLSV